VIRAIAKGKDGPLIILGVTEANLERLREGQPINVSLGAIFRAAHEVGAEMAGDLSVVVMYGATHRAVVDELAAAGIELPPNAAEDADAIDATL
jgi:hypothetical protein